ncbi:uncharacterized protein [Henckelia pumila]|uniref:uncharacterized protein n=1 Tax=Henckelia pumila TaxID=405737 RepID=UPI003C6E4914
MCPTLQEGSTEQVNAAVGFPGPPQQRNYDPYSNTFNTGWKDHLNLRYDNPSMDHPAPPPQNQAYRPPYHPQQHRPQIFAPGEFLENIVKDLATNAVTFQQETRASIQHLNTQENVSAITLRSGRELKVHEEVVKELVQNEEVEESKLEETELNNEEAPRDDIKQVPRYAKFLKELCTVKRKHKLKGFQKVELGEQVSAVIQRKVPTKCNDPAPLNETAIVIQIADRSIIYPRGVLEDVLVQVPKIETKLPPDRAKGMPKEKEEIV